MWLICRHTQKNLDAFIDNTLPQRARRRIARHIDLCPTCYQEFVRRRDLRRELQHSLPLVGRSHAPDFERLWGSIRAELPRSGPRYMQFRYGLAAFMLLLALLVPFTMGHQELSAIPQQPSPQTEASTQTPAGTDKPLVVATAIASSTETSSLVEGTSPPTLPEPDLNQ